MTMTEPNHHTALEPDGLRELLEAWEASDRPIIDVGLARRIAAALQERAGGALEHFARTGTLDANSALDELNEVRLPLERETWIDALGQFILEGDR